MMILVATFRPFGRTPAITSSNLHADFPATRLQSAIFPSGTL
jgi:hypothetical protein